MIDPEIRKQVAIIYRQMYGTAAQNPEPVLAIEQQYRQEQRDHEIRQLKRAGYSDAGIEALENLGLRSWAWRLLPLPDLANLQKRIAELKQPSAPPAQPQDLVQKRWETKAAFQKRVRKANARVR